MNKRGFTLMELLVYMAIVGIVVVIAGQVYSDSTKMRIRTQGMITANEIAENAGVLIRDDVSQMGAKSFLGASGYEAHDAVFIDPYNTDVTKQDYSSFVYKAGSKNDSLYFKKMRYSEDGSYQAVEGISWHVDGTSLVRSCQTIVNEASAVIDDACPKSDPYDVVIAEGVESFKIRPARPAVLSANADAAQLFPPGGGDSFRLLSRIDGTDFFRAILSPENGGVAVTISGFTSNYDATNELYTTERKANQLYTSEANGNVGEWSDLCTKVNLNPDTTYELSFTLPRTGNNDNSQTFIPGVDYMSVGFRTTEGNKIEGLRDFSFFPTTAASANSIARTALFKVNSPVEACIAFTFAPYSPLFSSGSIAISQLKLIKVADLNFTFAPGYVPELEDKVNVRAFKDSLVVKKNGETGFSSHIIAVPSNGVGAN